MTSREPIRRLPLLVVISGPSGVGKDAVLDCLRQVHPDAHFVVTATTRPRRAGEQPGVDYHFLSDEEFDRLLAENAFLERAQVYGYRYGVPKAQVREALEHGQDVILRVDVQGAATLKELLPAAVFIFLEPGSIGELEERLRDRNSDPEDGVQVRLAKAVQEMDCRKWFDHSVVNARGKLDEAVAQIIDIMEAERQKLGT